MFSRIRLQIVFVQDNGDPRRRYPIRIFVGWRLSGVIRRKEVGDQYSIKSNAKIPCGAS